MTRHVWFRESDGTRNKQAVKAAMTQGKRHYWTEDELDTLRREFDPSYGHALLSLRRLAARFGVSEQAVHMVLKDIGAVRRAATRKPWDANQDAYIAEHIGRHSRRYIARALGRTVDSLNLRISVLGLGQGYTRNGCYTLQEVRRMLGVNDGWLRARIDAGKLAAERDGVGGRTVAWRISEESLRDFVRRYPHDLQGRNVAMVEFVELLVGVKGAKPS